MAKKTDIIAKCIFFWFSAQLVLGRLELPCPALEQQPWSYEGRTNGPEVWGRTYPMCNGNQQSPINIKRENLENSNLQKLKLVNYGIPVMYSDIVNNGHTVEVTPRDGVPRYFEMDGSRFNLQQFHFHWSVRKNDATEHAFFGRRYNMEMHFVHSNDQNQIAVVGVLYQIGRKLKAIQRIVDKLPTIRYKDDESKINASINLNGMLPSNPASFFRYKGSLTTPPCTEGVTWSVLKKVYTVADNQLQQFYKLYAVPKDDLPEGDSLGCRISTNIRPLQKINDRRVALSR